MFADTDTNQSRIRGLISAGTASHAHLAGVCGIGMAGLAFLLRARGLRVSGCDRRLNPLADWLRTNGISVDQGHAETHLDDGVSWIVRSAAVSPDCAEIQSAVRAGLPVFSRGEVLPVLIEDRLSVAVAGTHGKTTTSTFITRILKSAGLKPAWCIGGQSQAVGPVAGDDGGKIVVVEADESDGSLAAYAPDVAVLTNIDFDHMEHFGSRAEFEQCFRRFMARTRRRVVYCADDDRTRELARNCPRSLSFGLKPGAQVTAARIEDRATHASFELLRDGELLGRVELPAGGRHNVLNALAAAAACLELGLEPGAIAAGLGEATLPRRRFEQLADRHGVRVISDYAHHPAEIKALVSTARGLGAGRLLGLFQPHRYTRTLALGPDFPPAFEGLDTLVLTPVYAASETVLTGGTVWDLYAHCREQDPDRRIYVGRSLAESWGYLRRELRDGDVLLVIGAGDAEDVAVQAADYLAGAESLPAHGIPPEAAAVPLDWRPDEPLAARTTWKVGGRADLWGEVDCAADLAKVLRGAGRAGLPVHVLGAGSNLLVSDLGLRGITLQLKGGEFTRIRVQADEIAAGAGTALATLLARAEKQGLSGLEFLEGIPGTLGGALWMNAGAFGEAIGSRVSWIRCLNADGSECIVGPSELGAAYRRCAGLAGRVVVEAGLCVMQADSKVIHARRNEVRARRLRLAGMRCAGSVFRNPEGDFAGRLIEAAGLKGRRVGGARVYAGHANVITTDPGARASDVAALIELVRVEVLASSGVLLQPEIEFPV